MTNADDHWPATLQRVVAALDFQLSCPEAPTPVMTALPRDGIENLPSLVQTAVYAAIEIDQRVAGGQQGAPVDREARVARKNLIRALAAAHNGGSTAFAVGYDAAYRLQLERVVWTVIADHPRLRIEELAATRV